MRPELDVVPRPEDNAQRVHPKGALSGLVQLPCTYIGDTAQLRGTPCTFWCACYK